MNQGSARQLNSNIHNNINNSNIVQPKVFNRAFKVVLCLAVTWLSILGVIVVSSSIKVNRTQANLSQVTSQISSIQKTNSSTQQEVSELSSDARLEQMAKKFGLSMNEQNTRNVDR